MKTFRRFLKENYSNWVNKEPVEYAKHLTKTFGQPDELTDSQLCWFSKDGFKRIVIKDEYILHGSPAPHYDFIYCYIDLKVPESMATALAESSGSIMVDYLKGEVGARCGSITANATTLNYCLDAVAGRVTPSKQEYEKRILGMKKMFSDGKKYELDWWPDETNDANPNNNYYAEGHSIRVEDITEEKKGLAAKAEKSGISLGVLKKVYNRGMAAWRTGHRPGTTPQQWGMARVNSFITKGSGTWGKADKDLADRVRSSKKK